jgi:hypothetical protein
VSSVVRATAFNRPVVEDFFIKYSQFAEKHKPGPKLIYNVDESGLSAVHNPVKGSKQVGSVTSGETAVTVTIIGYIKALNNSIPLVLTFPHLHFRFRYVV